MAEREYKYVDYTEQVRIAVPVGLSPAEEADFVARFKAEHPPEQLAAEARELQERIEAFDQGRPPTTSLEGLLRDIDRAVEQARQREAQ